MNMSEIEPMLQFFGYSHLPESLQSILPRNPERTAALRKLLEAKDCAVRANIYK
jgi:hypothetical protein